MSDLENSKRYIRATPRGYGLSEHPTEDEIEARARQIHGLPAATESSPPKRKSTLDYVRESSRAYGLPKHATEDQIRARALSLGWRPNSLEPRVRDVSSLANQKVPNSPRTRAPAAHGGVLTGYKLRAPDQDEIVVCEVGHDIFLDKNGGYNTIEVSLDHIVFRGPKMLPYGVPFDDVLEPVQIREGRTWGAITIVVGSRVPIIMRGFVAGSLIGPGLAIDSRSAPFRQRRAEEEQAERERRERAERRTLYDARAAEIEDAFADASSIFHRNRYVTVRELQTWLAHNTGVRHALKLLEPDERSEKEREQTAVLEPLLLHPTQTRLSHNGEVLRRERAKVIVAAAARIESDVAACRVFFERAAEVSANDRLRLCEDHQFAVLYTAYDQDALSPRLREVVGEVNSFFASLDSNITEHNKRVESEENLKFLLAKEDYVRIAARTLEGLRNWRGYLRVVHTTPLWRRLTGQPAFWAMPLPRSAAGDVVDLYRELRRFVDDPEIWRGNRNRDYVSDELQRTSQFFDDVIPRKGGFTLTSEQRIACILDDSRVRIVAGAGSGKTTVLLAKAAYLVEVLGTAPERILAITYSQKSRNDLRRRFAARASLRRVEISTIHGTGSTVLAASRGRKAPLPSWHDNPEAFARRIDGYVQDAFGDASLAKAMTNLILFNSREIQPPYRFETVAQYFDYQRHVKPISLRGEMLKSLQECLIANFLFVNGIDYRYEERYVADTASALHRQYMPDFFIPSAGLYIEHYGISRNGETAPNIDSGRYLESIAWKRSIHERQGTICLETFSYEAVEGTLLRELENELRKHGVVFSPIPAEAVLSSLEKRGRITVLHELFKRFVDLFKQRTDDSRTLADYYAHDEFCLENLVPALSYLLNRYETDLRAEQAHDFSDMIVEAKRLLDSATLCPFDVVLLDEAQDLSPARAELIRSLCRSGSDVRFCAVGDDWQSIYRFSGSDTKLFLDFEQFFGPAAHASLNVTHRSDEKIALPAAAFIRRNRRQTQRTPIARPAGDDRPRLSILEFQELNGQQAEAALEHLASRWELKKASVLIIARVKSEFPTDIASIARKYPTTKVECVTAHSAKGLEKDFAIVVGAVEGWNGFPTLRPSDPLLEPLLPVPEDDPLAEDRRLFYVAMTRALKAVVFCARAGAPSRFLSELRELAPSLEVVAVPSASSPGVTVACRSCGVGRYIVKGGPFGLYASCSEFPRCRESTRLCPQCKGVIEFVGDEAVCCGAECSFSAQQCGRCRRGWLVGVAGRPDGFRRCSRWRPSVGSCDSMF
ncbi:MAG: helicase [Candidatus Eremiobacteraeota bacterium]|nr:helicase [Candidatus Eremiobacteraeota bacterium]